MGAFGSCLGTLKRGWGAIPGVRTEIRHRCAG